MFISRTNEPVENFATPPAGIAEVDSFIQWEPENSGLIVVFYHSLMSLRIFSIGITIT